MRKLKRLFQRLWGELRLSPRRAEVIRELRAFFKLKANPRLVPSGGRGHDSTYFVFDGRTPLGVLRLANPYKKRSLPSPVMPFRLENTSARITREFAAYGAGAGAGLTPKPLWRTQDALLCEYLPLRPLQDMIGAAPEKSWDILCAATTALRRLHGAGLTHMDASLANILGDAQLGRIAFVDFEYAPAEGLSPAAQRVYDHLRLLESAWKFIPPALQKDPARWLACLGACLDDEMRHVDLIPLAPALERILQVPELAAALRVTLSKQ